MGVMGPDRCKTVFNLSKSILFSGPPKIGKTLLMKTLMFMLSDYLIERAEADGRLQEGHAEAAAQIHPYSTFRFRLS